MRLATFWRRMGLGILLGLTACATDPNTHNEFGIPDHAVAPGWSTAEVPAYHRVLLLPTATARQPHNDFAERLDTILAGRIGQRVPFEMLPVTRDELTEATGVPALAAHDILPPDFFAELAAATGAEAVLFSELTVLQPWRPIAIGLRFRLVDLSSGEVVWAFDDVFDSGNPQVAVSAQRFSRAYSDRPFPLDTASGILQSPIAFAEFAVWEALRTLPPT
jgi:hypothetical protein